MITFDLRIQTEELNNQITKYIQDMQISSDAYKRTLYVGINTIDNIILAYANVQEFGATMTVTRKQRYYLLAMGFKVSEGSQINIPAKRFLTRTFDNPKYQADFVNFVQEQILLKAEHKINTETFYAYLGNYWVTLVRKTLDDSIKHKDLSTGNLSKSIGYWFSDTKGTKKPEIS